MFIRNMDDLISKKSSNYYTIKTNNLQGFYSKNIYPIGINSKQEYVFEMTKKLQEYLEEMKGGVDYKKSEI